MTDAELAEIEKRCEAALKSGADWETLECFYENCDTDIPRLIAALREARERIATVLGIPEQKIEYFIKQDYKKGYNAALAEVRSALKLDAQDTPGNNAR